MTTVVIRDSNYIPIENIENTLNIPSVHLIVEAAGIELLKINECTDSYYINTGGFLPAGFPDRSLINGICLSVDQNGALVVV